MKNETEKNFWCSMPKGNKFLFMNPEKNILRERGDVAKVEKDFDMSGVYVVKLKLSSKYAIYDARRDELSPKFDKFVFSKDMRHFVVENKKYQTIYDLFVNRFANVQGDEILPIKNCDAFAIRTKEEQHANSYQIYDTNSGRLYGKFAQYDTEALVNHIRVKKELGWQKDTFILNLATGQMTLSTYEKMLYNKYVACFDLTSNGIDEYSQKISSLTPEHLLYCLPQLEGELKKEMAKETKTKKAPAKLADEEIDNQPEK